MNKGTGLVLEGGAMRGLFTAGVLDVMMEKGIDRQISAAVGVSAGAVFGCNLKSRQHGRAIRYNLAFSRDWRYSSWRSLLRTGNLYGEEFCYDTLPNELDPFDSKAFASQGQQRCCALALKLSQIEYVKEVSGEYPVLLLDDVMSELDQYRRNQLISFINDKVQTIITVNDKALIPDFGSNQYFYVEKGNISSN